MPLRIEIGHIQTVTGAGGGVIFTPSISSHEAKEMIADLRDKLSKATVSCQVATSTCLICSVRLPF